ncbi:MAG: hypothetical protein QM656_00805 [Paracoccaceae bacterium]
MIAANAFGMPASGWLGSQAALAAQTSGRTCVVRLVDRRTGATHRVNGTPLVLFTRRPSEAVAELLTGRDPSVWEARIEPIEPEVRR